MISTIEIARKLAKASALAEDLDANLSEELAFILIENLESFLEEALAMTRSLFAQLKEDSSNAD